MADVRFGTLANSTVIVTAVVYGVLLQLAGGAGIAGILLRIMVTLSLWRYAYAVLRHVASGWQNFPPPEIESMNIFGGGFTVILHSLLFVLALFFLATTPFMQGAWRWILLLAVLAIFPASAAIMAMTRNAAAALNPVVLTGFVRDLGGDYLKLLGVSLLLGVLLVLTSEVAARWWYLGAAGEAMSVWTVLALFLATGATLRAHRDDFDLLEALDDNDARETRRRHADWQKTLDLAYGSVRSGLVAQAYRTVKELIAREGESLEVYQWAFNGMLEWDPPEHAAMLGERFAQRLWEEGRKVDAMELTQRCRKLSPKFAPPAAFTAQLAEYARSIGRHRLADELSGR
ncbi:MAG TPA: hypothetical protein VHH11_08560 [Gammaproteobacteria bacterium]|jgi:hypothetical protein|nr:hypothetical protein [Gammaproteobacteria bacterium]